MKDIAFQLVMKWARQGEEKEILLTDDFTRLTLDTIALCTMDFRFNSFYSSDMHPFVDAMLGVLSVAGARSARPAIYNKVMRSSKEVEQFKADTMTMNRVAQQVIDQRRAQPVNHQDMLNTLLNGKDPKTGANMRDELVMANMITFLVAGHETTSGLLSFAFMNLVLNPRTYLKAQQEVDRILSSGPINEGHLKQLRYLNAVLRETMRLTPTAPIMSKRIPKSRQNEFVTICGGRHKLENDDLVRVLLGKAMRDPTYFGEDADEFRPERMLDDNPDFDRYMKAWKPFGNGTRSCIGQNFAWQEALLVMALVLQNFDMNLVDPGYKVQIKQALTVKPKNLYVKVRLRKGLDPLVLERRLHAGQSHTQQQAAVETTVPDLQDSGNTRQGLQILFGSNTGTCQALAQKLSSSIAAKLGITSSVRDLDSTVDNLSRNTPVVVITSSYEGQPPDNAARFVEWLESSTDKGHDGIRYAVFGCGHKDWHDTFHRIPKLVDAKLAERGASRLLALSTSDVSQGAVLDDFDQWQGKLIKQLQGSAPDAEQHEEVGLAEISTDMRASKLSSGLAISKISETSLLTGPGQPEKRHMEIDLQPETTYEPGDYLAILPINPNSLVNRIMKHWGLPRDAVIILKSGAFNLPINVPLGIHEILKGYFELSQPISRSNLGNAKRYTTDAGAQTVLDELLGDSAAFDDFVKKGHASLFDLLEQFKEIKLPFPVFLSSLLPLHVRQYSISSSPIASPSKCTITYSLVRHQDNHKKGGHQEHVHEGVASTYLSTLSAGDTVQIAVKRTATANSPCAFRLPAATSQSSTPMLMFCAGTGLAPFRGFIQQRALMLEQNPALQLAPALLFVGCRSSVGDRLYAEDFDTWQTLGAVDVRYAFSQDAEHELAGGCKYITDRMLHDIDDVRRLWRDGAKVYVCGSRKVQQSIEGAVKTMFEVISKQEQWDEEVRKEKVKAFQDALAQRAVSDIFD